MKNISFIIPCYNEEETLPLLYQRLNNVSKSLKDYESNFIFINNGSKDKTVIEAYKSFSENPKYIRGLISWMGFEQKAFEYKRESRIAGTTKYTFKKMLRLAITGILSFSVKPLRISLYFGIISIFIAIVFSLRVFYLYLFSSAELVEGWASTIIIILFMGGVQLISLSVISEYLANMFNQVKKRPEYIIKKII